MSALPARPAATAAPANTAGTAGDSSFDASAFDGSPGRDNPTRWIGWRRRAMVLAALLGCLIVFVLARLVAAAPNVNASWRAGAEGQLILAASALPELQNHIGQNLHALRGLGTPGTEAADDVKLNALALHRAPRWQVDDATREAQLAQQQAVARAMATGGVQLRFADGSSVSSATPPRGYTGLGLMFWPLAGLGLLVYLFGVLLAVARPQLGSLLYTVMALCQAANLWMMAIEAAPGLGTVALDLTGQFTLRVALDLCTGAAALHALVLRPRRLAHAGWMAAAGWAVVPAWALLAQGAAGNEGSVAASLWGSLWIVSQGAVIALGLATLAAITVSYRLEPNPYALVMRRFAAAAVVTLVLVSAAVAVTADRPVTGASMAEGASVTWYLFVASLLLLTPSLARTRQVLREFALLAGISTVATSLDLLFVAVFSLGSYTSLALAVFIALGLYAGARQWIVSHLLGSSMLTTERTFDQLYRAAREVQAHPRRYPLVLRALMRDIFEPLEMTRVDRVPLRARIIGGGSAMVVPVRPTDDEGASAGAPGGAPNGALALRFANRGQRLFTLDDARLADRLIDQLRRAVAYDQAVERGRSEERQRIAQDLHDDIGARLLTLMYQAQSREMEDYIRHTLQDLKTLTRGLAASEHRLSHAAAEWKADLTQRMTAAHATLGWSCTFDEDQPLSVVQWSALTRVLRELVSNALYHGHATRIEVSFALERNQLTLLVADDGEGTDPDVWAHGLGLGGVRKRVKLLGGKVAWRENHPKGIVCAVRVAAFNRPS